ncbi:MAG: protein translocase subunit SecD [Actinomycetales bacterium]|nr:protein translocase subunit SecD [Actinomycetales bacterium]
MAPVGRSHPWRPLLALLIVTSGLVAWALWPGTSPFPRLGLDLRGGTQVILLPTPVPGQEGALGPEQLQQTVEIIRQRVDGFGVAEAEVTVQGAGENASIVVAVPGVNQQRIAESLKQTALLDFRPVLEVTGGAPQAPVTPPATLGPQAPGASPSPTAPAPSADEVPITADTAEELQPLFGTLNCLDPAVRQGGVPADPTKYALTCAKDGSAQYLLEPAFITGTEVTDAAAQLPQQGVGGWVVTLDFDSAGSRKLSEASTRLYANPPPRNQFAIVLDGLVVSSPYFREPIIGGSAQIDGDFTVESAKELAQVLKYGALPVTLEIAEVTTVSATLGEDQLRAGLLAGGLGLLLVAIYLIAYYRVLGTVAVLSLLTAGILTYAAIVVLSRTLGFTLTLAGVAGVIVAIGITADSFVVYFERIRDEVREGKSLRVAADVGWLRARRTLLAADFVSLLAAGVLYVLSVGSVRGFAFTLGLTTIVDVIVAFMFSRPLTALLVRRRIFERGGPWLGVDAGRVPTATSDGRAAGARPPQRGRRNVDVPAG